MRKKEHATNIKPRIESVLTRPKAPIRLIVDNVRSLYNIGAMFRTGDSINIEQIHLCGICGKPPRKEITKTALETVKHVPWTYHERTIDAVKLLQEKGYTIYALEICDKSRVYDQIEYAFPCALMVGNEIGGIDSESLKLCDAAMEIPMHGIGVSLNVASAAAVGLVHMRRVWDGRTVYRSS